MVRSAGSSLARSRDVESSWYCHSDHGIFWDHGLLPWPSCTPSCCTCRDPALRRRGGHRRPATRLLLDSSRRPARSSPPSPRAAARPPAAPDTDDRWRRGGVCARKHASSRIARPDAPDPQLIVVVEDGAEELYTPAAPAADERRRPPDASVRDASRRLAGFRRELRPRFQIRGRDGTPHTIDVTVRGTTTSVDPTARRPRPTG